MLHFIYCFAECHYAECRYAECRGAHNLTLKILLVLLGGGLASSSQTVRSLFDDKNRDEACSLMPEIFGDVILVFS